MPPRDPNIPQLDNPELVAALITQLEIIGGIGLLNFVPAVSPVFIVGSRGLSISNDPPVYQSAQIFDGTAAAPVANTVVADSGALPAGDYDIWANIASAGSATAGTFAILAVEHRNAANAVTLATLLRLSITTAGVSPFGSLPQTGYRLALNERIRAITLIQTISGGVAATIGVRIRPTP